MFGTEVPTFAGGEAYKSPRKQKEQQERQAKLDSFPSMDDFEQRVLNETNLELLSTWEEYLQAKRRPAISCSPWLYVFATDARMTQAQKLRYHVLALAGHSIAERVLLVSSANHLDFYGAHVHTKSFLAKQFK